MNEQYSEQVFDSLLREMISGERPPDLTASIVAAWKKEQSSGANASNVAIDDAFDAPQNFAVPTDLPSTISTDSVTPPPVIGRSRARADIQPLTIGNNTIHTATSGTGISTTRKRTAFFLALVAATAFVVLGWGLRQPNDQGLLSKSSPTDNPLSPDAEKPRSIAESAQLGASGLLADNATSQSTRENGESMASGSTNGELATNGESNGRSVDLNDLPFTADSPKMPVENRPDLLADVKLQPLEPAAVIDEVNQALAALWQSAGVTPNRDYPQKVLAQQISRVLTGRPLADSQLNRFIDTKDSLNRNALVEAVAKSPRFPKLWAQQFVSSWLQVPKQLELSESQAQLANHVEQSIARGDSWNQVVESLLASELNSAGQSPSSAYFVSLAGGENHRLLNSIGTNFLNENLACVRCHDASKSDTQDGFVEEAADSQRVYWSLIATLKGIETTEDDQTNKRTLADRQSELFASDKQPVAFYDLPSGVLKAASAGMPKGQSWSAATDETSPRVALARWVGNSDTLDKATVNLVWKMVFGRHLVSQVPQVQEIVSAEREKVLEVLATQFKAHGRDVRQLVGWIVASDAFAKQPLVIDKSQWLDATDQQMAAARRAELVFASGPTLGRSQESDTLESSLAAVVRWRGNGRSINASVMLAQPNIPASSVSGAKPKPGAAKAMRDAQGSVEMPSLAFVYHADDRSPEHRRFVKSLLRSDKLSWDDRVNHIVGLRANYGANGRVRKLAKELLEYRDGNAEEALLDLLWAVENSSAST